MKEKGVSYLEKNVIRKAVLALREEMKTEEIEEKSQKIMSRLREMVLFQQSLVIMTYVGFGSEVATLPFIAESLALGKRVVVPVCMPKSKELLISEIKDPKLDLQPQGRIGLLEPPKERLSVIDPQEIDLILMPGIAFDRQGGRVGYGAGYYDRFLASFKKCPLLVALSFDCQLVEAVPVEKHDIPVDWIITENEMIPAT